MTFSHGGREVTIEISSTKMPASSRCRATGTPTAGLARLARRGAGGGARGGTSSAGGPLDARVEVVGRDTAADNSYVCDRPRGRRLPPHAPARQLHPALHRLRPRDPEVANVVVASGAATRVDVALQQAEAVSVSGQVTTPDGRGAVAGATVEILGTGLAPATTGADGTYSFATVYTGPYTFRVAAAGFETVEAQRTVSTGSSVFDFVLAPYQTAFSTDLETSNGGLVATPTTNAWEWGVPSGTGNPGAHSGSKVWATNLEGEYCQQRPLVPRPRQRRGAGERPAPPPSGTGTSSSPAPPTTTAAMSACRPTAARPGPCSPPPAATPRAASPPSASPATRRPAAPGSRPASTSPPGPGRP